MKPFENLEYYKYLQSDKWKNISQERMRIDKYQCVMCGSRGTANNPLQVHHLSYAHLYHEENRIYEDLETLCANCHASIHKAMERVTSPTGRKGWKDNARIPDIHIYTVNGLDIEQLERRNKDELEQPGNQKSN